MKTTIQKWGNSLALRIPKAFADELGLERDSLVELTMTEKPWWWRPRRRQVLCSRTC